MTWLWQVFHLYFQRQLKRRGHAFLLFCTLIILLIDGLNPSILNPVRRAVDTFFWPLDNILVSVTNTIDSSQKFSSSLLHQASELEYLREENRNLRQWQLYAKALEIENQQMQSYFASSPSFAAAEIQHFRISKRLPSEQILELPQSKIRNIPNFAAVISGSALIGRLLTPPIKNKDKDKDETSSVPKNSQNPKQIMLLSHPNSRIPVQVGFTGIQAMLVGLGHTVARLEYHHNEPIERIKIGDRVMSSGYLGYLPSGLPVGTITNVRKEFIEVTLNFDPELLRYVGIIIPLSNKKQLRVEFDEKLQ